ncbi:hypothetical protein GCM10017044_16090 [Kordiimonas sediminis]|uniref:Flagellar FliJ protein n=1 Tax=Kordiimonas sediminis TaxID=1735581 RepID=A0A919ATU5_9PROT|nr:flagellar FliJ family protein [Kordiimonas sediminis]GHF22529.1 hypothetical protein GCM10017044_16090 [Kordiimonas sediminis]
MSRLDGIIRLYKWELDEKRRELVDLQEQVDRVQEQIEMLHQEVEDQKQHAATEAGLTTMGAYLEGVRKREQMLRSELRKREEAVAKQQERVSEAFSELKTYEIARDKEKARQVAKVAKVEQAEFDEQGLRRSSQRDASQHPQRKR